VDPLLEWAQLAVLAVALGWLWLREAVTWPVLIGGAVILAAVGLAMVRAADPRSCRHLSGTDHPGCGQCGAWCSFAPTAWNAPMF
jgi:uncharacterized membrane protein AbrB (regulator of aidB expression)